MKRNTKIIIIAVAVFVAIAAVILTVFILKKDKNTPLNEDVTENVSESAENSVDTPVDTPVDSTKIVNPAYFIEPTYFSRSDNTVTMRQFLEELLLSDHAKSALSEEFDEENLIDKAFELGILEDGDMESVDSPVLRQTTARLVHNTMVNLMGEEDEEYIDAARQVSDMFTCHACVQHVVQVYVKGILLTCEDGMLHGEAEITGEDANYVINRLYDTSLRVPKLLNTELPENSDEGKIDPSLVMDILLTHDTALLLDVRTPEEYSTGYIMNSSNVPLADIQADISNTIIPEDKETVLIVYCQSGGRSAEAYRLLKEAGYTNVYDLGGIEDWPYDIVE